MFAAPVSAGLCSWEFITRTATWDDVADMNEILIVQAENQRRANAAAERKAKARSKRRRR